MKTSEPKRSKLEAIIGREDSVRAALQELHLRRRAQERKDRAREGSEIGEAMLLADADETDAARRSARRAFISEALDRYTKGPSREFMRLKSWLP
jgi:hypothetical protein